MNKVALITGTTSGIGEAFSRKLAMENYTLILISRDEKALKAQALHLETTYGISVFTFALDLLTHDGVQSVFKFVEKLNLKITVLINNAGFNEAGAFLDTDLTKECQMIDLHIKVTTKMTKLFLPQMIENQHGRILNLGSTGSYMPCPCDAVYAATKAYILSFSKAIHAECKSSNVAITTLCPGPTRTAFATKANMENTRLFNHFVMTPEKVAQIGYTALMKGKVIAIPGLYNKLTVLSSKILPSCLINSCTRLLLKRVD